ncbi:MAG: histone [Chlamydiota bacterium]
MALKDTMNKVKDLLCQISKDIDKSERGNKAAAQRVRTGTIRLEKVAKLYRKESIAAEKKGGMKKPAAKKSAGKKAPVKKAAAKKAPAKKASGKKAKKRR